MAGTKKHEASPQKLRKAREQGQVAPPKALIHALAMVVGAEATIASVQWWWPALQRMAGNVLDRAVLEPEAGLSNAADALVSWAMMSGALLLVSVTVAVGVGMLLTGFLFAPSALTPNVSRIDPVATAKNMFGPRGWAIFLLGLLKLGAFLLVASLQIQHNLPALASSWRADEFAVGATVADLLLPIIRAGEFVLLSVAAIEWAVERYMFAREQRMDDAEMMRDYRESEGDPHQKAMRRALSRQALESVELEQDEPDMVLANPTHFAVALVYRMGTDAAPKILRKFRDADALSFIDRMVDQGVIVIRSPVLTRALFEAGTTGMPVPADFYRPIAVLYRLLFDFDLKARGPVVDIPESLVDTWRAKRERDQAQSVSVKAVPTDRSQA